MEPPAHAQWRQLSEKIMFNNKLQISHTGQAAIGSCTAWRARCHAYNDYGSQREQIRSK